MSELQYQREIFFSFIDTHNAKFMEYAFCNFQLMDKDHKFREFQKKIDTMHFIFLKNVPLDIEMLACICI